MAARSLAGWILAGTCLVALAMRPSPLRAGEECSGCSLLGSLSVTLVSQEPEEPRVGDAVAFTYAYSAQIPGSVTCNGCVFSGGAPVLAGSDFPVLSGNRIVVERTAVAAGTTSVELQLRAETEEQCFFDDPELGCQSFFQPAFIDASSGPHEVSVAAEPPTPTPTPTEVPADTATPSATATDTPRRGGGDEDDGCAIAPASPHGGALLLLAALPILLRRKSPIRRG